MRISASIRPSFLLSLKLIFGSVMVIAVMANGIKFSGCSMDVHCMVNLEFYSMRLDPWSVLAAVVGVGLSLSGFRDLLASLGDIEVLGRNTESIADIKYCDYC